MNKKLLSMILVVSIVFSITGCKRSDKEQTKIDEMIAAGGDTSFSAEQKHFESNNDIKDLPALTLSDEKVDEINATITLADQTSKDIVFSETQENMDIYLDENQNKYKFNTSNELISYSAALDFEKITTEPSISKEQADQIARDHIKKTYGDHLLDGFSLKACNESNTYYDLQYLKSFGENGFVSGELCVVWVNYNGGIDYSNVIHAGSFDRFNEALLNGITEGTIQTFANQQAAVTYPDQSFTCTINSIWLKEGEDGYYLSILAVLSGIEEYKIPVEYTYPLQ